MEVKWIEFKGKKIVYSDFRGAKDENDMIETLKYQFEFERIIIGKNFLRLTNFENTFVTQKFLDEIKRLGKELMKEKKVKSAIIGIVGIKKIFVSAYIKFTGDENIKTFNNEEDAKNWLVE
jgi:hypothetical protein